MDIDGGPELELVSRIADNEGGLARLVDELYFEYHFCACVAVFKRFVGAWAWPYGLYRPLPYWPYWPVALTVLCLTRTVCKERDAEFDTLNFGWQTHRGGQNFKRWGNRTVDEALALMQRLRRQGVRAHFWV